MRDDMRLHVKKELLKMIQMLMEANETIQNNIGVSEINLMVDLLVSCQQSAIQVGENN